MSGELTGAGAHDADEDDRPGDPACLLRRVCQACGAVADHDPPTVCPQCHAEMPAD
jgi:rubrerythrin